MRFTRKIFSRYTGAKSSSVRNKPLAALSHKFHPRSRNLWQKGIIAFAANKSHTCGLRHRKSKAKTHCTSRCADRVCPPRRPVNPIAENSRFAREIFTNAYADADGVSPRQSVLCPCTSVVAVLARVYLCFSTGFVRSRQLHSSGLIS